LASNFTFSQDNYHDKRAWQDAYKELRSILDTPVDKIVLGHPGDVPRSLWASMKMCLDSLQTRDANAILSLLYASKGESLPEEVLRILHGHKKTSSSTFRKSTDELLMRELVKRSRPNVAPWVLLANERDIKSEVQVISTIWSIRSLVKLYMEAQMTNQEEVKLVVSALVGFDKEMSDEPSLQADLTHPGSAQDANRVAITLCALYFDPCHSDSAVTDAVTQSRMLSNLCDCDESLMDLRRKAVEPIIWLLDQTEAENWSQGGICTARKV
jgi:hypothetical protein